MAPFINPVGRAKAARIALVVYIVAQAVEMVLALALPRGSQLVDASSAFTAVALIGTVIVTGRWIYRVNANAHSFADGLTITPGWNVGWFFVPFANLWKPYEGITQVWQASIDPAEWQRVEVPGLLRGWWGFWIAGNIAGNLSQRTSRYVEPGMAVTIDLIASALLIVAAVLLIRIVADLSARQPIARAAAAFA